MSTSHSGAGWGQQQGESIQDMMSKMELGAEDIKALEETEMEEIGKGGYGDVFLIKGSKFKVSWGYGGRLVLRGCMVICATRILSN